MTQDGGSELIKKVLGTTYIHLLMDNYSLCLRETGSSNKSLVILTIGEKDNRVTIESSGYGLIDALLSGLITKYSPEYSSLKSIELTSFEVKTKLDTKYKQIGSDAIVDVTIGIKNAYGSTFYFVSSERSLATAAAKAVVKIIEFFINAEKAYITLRISLTDAKKRNRQDLVSKYTGELFEIVKYTSYVSVSEKVE